MLRSSTVAKLLLMFAGPFTSTTVTAPFPLAMLTFFMTRSTETEAKRFETESVPPTSLMLTAPLAFWTVVSPLLFWTVIDPNEFSIRCEPRLSRKLIEPWPLTISLDARSPSTSTLPKRFRRKSGARSGMLTSRSAE